MRTKPYSVMVVEDNPGDIRYLQEIMKDKASEYQFYFTDTLLLAMERLKEHFVDIILLDLNLPDSKGFETFSTIQQRKPDIPVIILSGLNDESISIQTVKEGAQDYLMKGEITSSLLTRSIRYAIERHELKKKTYNLSLIDQLTGLYNRNGFEKLLDQEIEMAAKLKRIMYLMFADLDDLKLINDQFGHREGDIALIKTAELLKSTFRNYDILARLGGDEFVVLILDEKESIEDIVTRLNSKIEEYQHKIKDYCFSISFGFSVCDPHQDCSIEELLSIADTNMYKAKRVKKMEKANLK